MAPSTAQTYDFHLRQIRRACSVLGECALPAHLDTVRRVTSVVGNPSTLRGWLAAWRRIHCLARLAWAGDRDPVLLAVRVGLRQTLGPAPPRQRCRRPLLRRLLAKAAEQHAWELGAFMVLAYTFGLRVPSELVKQAKRQLFKLSPTQVSYGPIRRKGQHTLQTLTRWCVCKSNRLLCAHDWLLSLFDVRPTGLLFPSTSAQLMRGVVSLLVQLGVPDAAHYISHCFRRGAGVDVLEEHGLQAMLRFGQWSSPHAAEPYASADEQTARALGQCLADASDDDA